MFKPAAAADYNIAVIAKDEKGHTAKRVFTVNAAKRLKNLSTVSAKTIIIGQEVKITGAASGGIGAYKYSMTYKKSSASKWSVLQALDSNSSVTFKPSAAAVYDIAVIVKDAKGHTSKKVFTVTALNKLENHSVISGKYIVLGESVKLTGSAKGGAGEYQYAVTYKSSTAEKPAVLRSYSAEKEAVFKPDSAGVYELVMIVKDANGSTSRKSFTLTVNHSFIKKHYFRREADSKCKG